MSTEPRYSLTRICLNRGQISCTQSLANFFPAKGTIKVTDTITGAVLELTSDHSDSYKPRIIQGLDSFYREHGLQVNDTISFKYAEDGNQDVIHITPVRGRRKMNFNSQSALKALVNHVIQSPKPLSESDIHAAYPDLPHNADLNGLFKQDSRIVKREGRWQNSALKVAPPVSAPSSAETNNSAAQVKQRLLEAQKKENETKQNETRQNETRQNEINQKVAVAADSISSSTSASGQLDFGQVGSAQVNSGQSGQVGSAQVGSGQLGSSQDTSAQLFSPNQSLGRDASQRIEAFHQQAFHNRDSKNASKNANNTIASDANTTETPQNGIGLRDSIAKGRPAFFGNNEATRATNTEQRASGMQEISSSISGFSDTAHTIPETSLTHERAIEFTGDYAVLHKKARERLEPLGFTVSSVEQGQLLIQAEMGRGKYTVLMYLLPDVNSLNWTSALAQRRNIDVNYLSVLGNRDDLSKIDNSASFVQASMWSWQALDRIVQINKHIDVGPAALEPCFRDTGLGTPQVEVFQNLLSQHLQEVGLFSQIIHSLASRKVPSIFLLDDIMTELNGPGMNAPRDVVVATLKTLSQVPFNLIQKADNHEFVITKDIASGLARLENYTTSLKTNLPERTSIDRIIAAPDET